MGRFPTQDRFAEKYYDLTPYQYAANNAINYIDMNGDSIIKVIIDDQTGYIHGQTELYIDHTILYDVTQIIHSAAATKTHIHINSTFRTNKKQESLQGNSNALTPAKPGKSTHNAGLAIDFNLYKDNDTKKGLVSKNATTTGSNAFIDAVKNDMWLNGWRWGGDFTRKDRIHIDKRGSNKNFETIRDANQKQMNGSENMEIDESLINKTKRMSVGGTRRSQNKINRLRIRSSFRQMKRDIKELKEKH